MNERKAIKARRISEKEIRERESLVMENELIETLRLCNGAVEEKQLKEVCYWLKIDAAVQSGWLTERRNPDGTRSFSRGPNLKPRKLKSK